MTTIAELRTQLSGKGFQLIAATTEQQAGLPKVTLHLHPLSAKPVVLVGEDGDGARDYQTTLVTDAIKRR